MTNKKFFSGNSVKQAVLQAARHFQLAPEDSSVTGEVAEGGDPAGASRPAAAQAHADQVGHAEEDFSQMETAALPVEREPLAEIRQEAQEQRSFSADTARPAPDPAFSGDRLEAAEESIRQLLELGGLDLKAEVSEREHEGELRLEVELNGADEDLLLDDRGRILMSIQHLLPRLMRGLTGESMPCRVDCDNFHEIRAEQLRHLAQRVAAEVRDSERSQMLEPMAPDERRIVHLTLADDPAVETASQGNGLFKRVQVRPTRNPPGGFDR